MRPGPLNNASPLAALLVAVSALYLLSCAPQTREPALPNVVFILADDMGWGDVEAYNPDSLIPTPNINRLAEEGLLFTDAHSGCALCTPTRYGILTGRFYWRTHKKHSLVMPYDPPVIPQERLTWARIMQEAGYRTAFVGKWHLGLWYPAKKTEGWGRQYTMTEAEVDFGKPVEGGPCDLGFDMFFGTAGCSTSDSPYCFIRDDRWVGTPTLATPEDMNAQPGVVAGLMAPDWHQEKVDTELARAAVAFIADHQKTAPEKPFFLYYALSAPHIPWIPPEFIRGASREGSRGDMNALVDWCVGEVTKALASHGYLENTLIIFTSDNGPRRGANGHRSAGPFRGYKNSAYEGGHRVPFIVRWPGRVPTGGRSDIPICLNDMLATFAALLDYPLPDSAAEDSFDILPAFFAPESGPLPRPALIADTGGHVADRASFSLREGAWKLLEIVPRPAEATETIRYELYNLDNDLAEENDLSGKEPEILDRLKALLRACKHQGLRFIPKDIR
jgi:arylsulfatase A